MNKTMKKPLSVLIAGVVLTSLLTGCGSQSTSATQSSDSNSSASSTTSNQSQGQQHSGQHRNGQGLEKALENAGASQSDAQTLAKLIQTTHTDPKWVMDQLKNKTSVSDITSEINNGKAPKMQFNGNHNHNADGQNSQSGSGSN